MFEPARSSRGVNRRRSVWRRVGAAVALSCLTASVSAEKFPSESDGFDVDRTAVRWDSPDKNRTGWMEVLDVTGKGKTPGTEGSSFEGSVTVNVSVANCPTPDGIVKGSGHYSATLNLHTRQRDGMHHRLVSVRADVEYTGHVGEDARLISVDAETTYQYESRGEIRPNGGGLLGVPPTSFHPSVKTTYPVNNGRFGDAGISFPDPLQAQLTDAALLSELVTWVAQPAFMGAELAWHQQDACVTIKFDPPSSTTRVAPGESIRVQAELRTTQGSTPVGAGFQDAEPVAGGSVTPRQGRSGPASPIPFTYTAPQDKATNKGFAVAARSRAGATGGVWAPLASDALKFEALSFVCVIQVPGQEPVRMEQRITGESCGDPGNWTIHPTNIVRGVVDVDPPFETSCVPAGSPAAESQLRARRARAAGAGGWTCTYTRGANDAMTLTFWNFKSSFCQGAKEEQLTVTARPMAQCGNPEPPPPSPAPPQQRPPPPSVPVLPPL